MTEPRPSLDVSHLPPIALDSRSTAWWGNTLFMMVESTSVTILLVSYYYTKQNFPHWPPPHADDPTRSFDNLPGLGFASSNLVLLLATLLPMAWTERAARRGDAVNVVRGLALLTILGILAVVVRGYEFPSLKFRWDENAYASITWALVFAHLTYLAVATVEVAVTAFWIVVYGMGENLADDVTLTAIYWYWMVGLFVPIYVTAYWAPRLL